MSTTDSLDDRLLRYEAFRKRHSRESLERYAGMREHPDDTLARLQASGEWDRFGAKLFWQLENAARARKSKDVSRDAWEAFQGEFPPPADAVPCPTVLELRREDAEKARALESRRAEKREERGTRPPKLTAEEKERFRSIDAEMASGRLRRDSLDDMQWVYEHLDDDEVTAMDAPSRGAWTRLFHARYNRVKFLDTTWPNAEKELTKRKGEKKTGTVSENEQKCRDEIRAMIRAAVKHSKEIEADNSV